MIQRRGAGPLGLAIMMGLSIGGGVAAQEAGQRPEALPDAEVSDAVTRALIVDPAVEAHRVDVAANHGIVTLSGSVSNLLAHDRAVEIAETIKGVRGVINRIEVQPGQHADEELRDAVVEALRQDPATDAWELQVRVENGTVYLRGKVGSWQEKQLSARVAKGVAGVRAVEDELGIDWHATRTPDQIRQEVLARLRWDVWVDQARVEVEVREGGAVVLSGVVGSAAEKRRARILAWVQGVESVDTGALQVEGWARDPRLRGSKFVGMNDEQIAAAIQDALFLDPRVASYEVQATVREGAVTLRGMVDNLKALRAAASDARNVVGVWSVENLVRVRGEPPADPTIQRRIEDALRRDPYVQRYGVRVDVRDGVVTLRGDVPTSFARAQADDLAARVRGVAAVQNELRVERTPLLLTRPRVDYGWSPSDYDWYGRPVPGGQRPLVSVRSDREVERDIESRLWWDPFVDADRITIDVRDGLAHLTGAVDSEAMRQAATDAALRGGAAVVRNDLVIAPGPAPVQKK